MKTYLICMLTAILITGCGRQAPPSGAESGRQNALRYTMAQAFLSEIELRDGVYYRKGDPQPFSGVAIEIALEGYRRQETHFVGGKLNGPQIRWKHNGDLSKVTIYEDNLVKYDKDHETGGQPSVGGEGKPAPQP